MQVYYPYLLLAKKRYAGLYWTTPEKPDKMDAKGIVLVRRDNCKLAVRVVAGILKHLMHNKDIHAAVQVVKDAVADLMDYKIR